MSVMKELRKLSNEPLDGIKVQINEDDVTDVSAEITGPGAPAPAARAARRATLWTEPAPAAASERPPGSAR